MQPLHKGLSCSEVSALRVQPCRSQTNFKVRHFAYENILQPEQSVVVSVALQTSLPLGGKGGTGEHAELSTSPGPEPARAGPDLGTQRLKMKGEPSAVHSVGVCVNAPPHGVTKKAFSI